jgi:hypothetical protein
MPRLQRDRGIARNQARAAGSPNLPAPVREVPRQGARTGHSVSQRHALLIRSCRSGLHQLPRGLLRARHLDRLVEL